MVQTHINKSTVDVGIMKNKPAKTGSVIGIVFADFGPYHVTRMNALAAELKKTGSTLIAFRFSESSDLYGWKPVIPEGITVITLAGKYPANPVNALKLALRFYRRLRHYKVQCVFLPSYSPLPNLLCFLSVKVTRAKAVLMNESWSGTEQTGFAGRLVKRLLVRSFDAGLVGGIAQKEYALKYGLNSSKIFLGYDVVDVGYFFTESERWKKIQPAALPVMGLPSRFFLSLGRFVSKKNLPAIVQAYSRVTRQNPVTNIALVFVGEGSEELALKTLAAELGIPIRNGLEENARYDAGPEIVFYPFQQVDKTPLFFSRCECFILPSFYEEWGLVVNEAMACGVPVLVSDKVGCVPDLIVNGKNGYTFNPLDTASLAGLLQKFIDDASLSSSLGSYGQKHIAGWGPERFAGGAVNAMAAAGIIY